MKFKALCTDIDGTLLDSRRELSPRTIAAIKKIPQEIPIILASSRMPSAMIHLQHELNITDHPLICYNGGYVIQNAGNSSQIFTSEKIPVSVCASIIALSIGTAIHVSHYNENLWHAPAVDFWTDREQRITKVNAVITNIAEAIEKNSGAHKLMCMGPEEEINQMQLNLTEQFSDQIHVYRSRPTYLELAPKSVSKATGLKLLLTKYEIDPTEVIAFGDNYNDIDLLQFVGWGVAVDNARHEVKAVAKEITARSIEDGVAINIEKYFG